MSDFNPHALVNDARPVHPIHGRNRLTLGVFSPNISNGCAITTADGLMQVDWPRNISLARMADAAGFELLVPVGRWAGFGGPSNFNKDSFETYTWAAGLGQGGVRSLSSAGLDRLAFCWLDYHAGLARCINDVAPLLNQKGLREG